MDDNEVLHQKMLEEKSRILYISNYDGTEPTLRRLFETCGKIASIIVIPDKERAYITFFTKEGAEEGVKQDAKWKINQKPIEVSRHQYYIKYANYPNKTPFSTTGDAADAQKAETMPGHRKLPGFTPQLYQPPYNATSPPQQPFNTQDSTSYQTPHQNPYPRSQKPHNAVDKSKSSGHKSNGTFNNRHNAHQNSKYISDSKSKGSKRTDAKTNKSRRDQPPLLLPDEVNRSVYVRNSRELLLNEEDLRKFFAPVGVVEKVIVAKWDLDEDHPTPESCIKGYGFVVFSSEESATKAVEIIHDRVFNDRKVKVRPARKRGK